MKPLSTTRTAVDGDARHLARPPAATSAKWCAATRVTTTSKLPSAKGRSSARQTTSGCIPGAGSQLTTSIPASRSRRATCPPPVATSSAVRAPAVAHSTSRSRSGPSRWASLVRYCSARSLQTSVMRRAPRRAWRPRASSARRAGWAARPRRGSARPSSAFVPSSRTTIGSSSAHLAERLQDPARDLVAARDPAEDVEEDRLHLRVARDHRERVDDALRVAAAAEVAEVGRAAAGERDDVDRRHRQPGAVAAARPPRRRASRR